jgi:O-acetyl-ADP-ribose deacetylase (regulator of RNase III)
MNQTIINKTLIMLARDDLTELEVDAIVNAANESLQLGGGVAGAIAQKGGHIIQQECNRIGHVPTGQTAITGAGSLPAKYVFHAVGPIWGSGDEDNKLRNAVLSNLKLAQDHQLKSIAFPAISSGIYGFPKDRCARVMLQAVEDYIVENLETTLQEIRFVFIDEPTYNAFEYEFQRRWGKESD